MIADRYYYNHLSANEKELYTVLYKGIIALDKEIYFPEIVSSDIIHRVFCAITQDNPHLYYFNQTHLGIGTTPFGSVFLPQYFCNREQIKTYNGRVQECVNKLVTNLDLLNCSELEKEKRIHDYMCLNVVYDHDALQSTKVNRIVAAHSIIGVFVKQRAVCEGIAKATKLLLNTVNVGCIVISGKASLFQQGEHAWNIVKVNGQAYQLDMTWDMANTKNELVNYDYFNLTDAAISRDHFDFTGVPVCVSDKANYFIMNNLVFDSMRHLEKYLLHGLQNGQLTFYFKMLDEGHKMEDIVMAARDFVLAEVSDGNAMAKVSASFNEEQRTARVTVALVV